MSDYDDNDPRVIQAKSDARAKVLEARAKLHPAAQVAYTILDEISVAISNIGCLIIILIVVVAFLAPNVLTSIFGK